MYHDLLNLGLKHSLFFTISINTGLLKADFYFSIINNYNFLNIYAS